MEILICISISIFRVNFNIGQTNIDSLEIIVIELRYLPMDRELLQNWLEKVGGRFMQ